MRFPLAVPHSLNLLRASREVSDPQDQMDAIFPSFFLQIQAVEKGASAEDKQ